MHEAGKEFGAGGTGAGQSLVTAAAASAALAKRESYSSYGTGANSAVQQEEGADLAASVRQYAHMALKRQWLILSIALVTVVLGGLHTLLKTPLYSATVRIQIEREPAKILEGGATFSQRGGGRNRFPADPIRALEKPRHGRTNCVFPAAWRRRGFSQTPRLFSDTEPSQRRCSQREIRLSRGACR